MLKAAALTDGKLCSKCKEIKPRTKFYKHRGIKDGLQTSCKSCRSRMDRERYSRLLKIDPDFYRKRNLQSMYGISLEEYSRILTKQNNVCAICQHTCDSGLNLCVDHNHLTGKVRGLLCFKCNRALGGFEDNPEYLERAMDYLCH